MTDLVITIEGSAQQVVVEIDQIDLLVSQIGPQGPPGPPGDVGSDGAPGAPGPAGPPPPVVVLDTAAELPGSPVAGTFYVVRA